MMSRAFSHYARYYDLLYREKDYAGEARSIDALLRAQGAVRGPLLDVGCGTGAHVREFARLGWRPVGVDLSADMIARAQAGAPAGSGLEFFTGAAAEFDLGRRFPVITSLFHVASYQAGPGELNRMLRNIRRHLAPGGLFLFDFWHGPGVRADPPAVRVRQMEDDAIRVTRHARPVHRPEAHQVDVAYEVIIEDKAGGPVERIEEVHHLRYFFLPELEAALRESGLTQVRVAAGFSGERLEDKSWYGLIVARAEGTGHG
jgi:SAM-dependent methyltransferase